MTTNRTRLRGRFLFGSTFLALGLSLALGVAGCETLEEIEGNRCGNLVVEPLNGEACDEDTPRCGKLATVGACRFICDYQDPTGTPCPTGLGCGLDGICRKSDGLLDSAISIAGGGTERLMSADFDGDGRHDIVAVGYNTADVHFLTTGGFVESTITLPSEKGTPAVGDIDGDHLADIVLASDSSLGVLLGQEDRSFTPQSYAVTTVANGTTRLIPLGLYTPDAILIGLREENNITYAESVRLDANGGHRHSEITLNIPGGNGGIPGSVVGAIATHTTADAKPCAVMSLEISSRLPLVNDRVVLAKRCDKENFATPLGEVILDDDKPHGGDVWGGVFFADADGDGETDLIFGVNRPGKVPMAVGPALYFISDVLHKLPLTDMVEIKPWIETYEAGNCYDMGNTGILASKPLAIADLNGDGFADIVDSRGVLLQNGGGDPFQRFCHSLFVPVPATIEEEATVASWAQAVVGDFNGDNILDVLAARKDKELLDLWAWHPGGFNTMPIYVGRPVQELVSGDLDGDTVADAAFRLESPFMNPNMNPNMSMMIPIPIFALFGNPRALPSAPRVLGTVDNAQHLTIGRIIGDNAAGMADPKADIAVISSNDSARMPLTLFQGNTTRNLVSPLLLQTEDEISEDINGTDKVVGMFISPFGVSSCDKFTGEPMNADDEPKTPSNIIALGKQTIWLAGCNRSGSSLVAHDGLELGSASFLFAPVDRIVPEDDPFKDQLAVLMTNPPHDAPVGMQNLGLGMFEHLGDGNFTKLPNPLPGISSSVLLSSDKGTKYPFTFADLDNNGLRDVIVTAKAGNQRKIFVFWNGDAKNLAGVLSSSSFREWDFVPDQNPNDDTPPRADNDDISDIAAINIDDDEYKELAILTRDNIYFADMVSSKVEDIDLDGQPDHILDPDRRMQIMLGGKAFVNVRGSQALLAIDADSDGIDDLVVAATGKLLLFPGAERLE